MSKSLVLAFFFLASLQCISAQFNMFESMFGHSQQQQQHQHQQPQHRTGSGYSDGVSCSQYLCPATLDCVARPKDCPCPNVEDIKCLILDAAETEDATIVCTRGQNGCAEVEGLVRKGVKSKKK